ncbi:carboxypeptidase-like regulatory domain-containing protein [Hamadaea tsunoensis]|uniref:carboxypeptidase-like regulatory domain-containing protein n=1 Tax=Hamadaea tsunoensis TaxID=53368 RepID=UPI0003F9B4A1|nr:carboxypeptidase-like regulatory domain-containing protein [Hamadaea tsunoensis]
MTGPTLHGPTPHGPTPHGPTPHGPIEAATADLLAWLGRAAGQPARLGAPDAGESTGEHLTLTPLDLRTQRQTRGTGAREPYRFGVRYLLTASGEGALGLLDRVLAAAVAAGEPQIVLEAGDTALWRALGVPPRPAFFVDVPVQIAYEERTAPPVRHPLQLRAIARLTLAGRVLGPGDEPLAAMRVEVVGTPLSTLTDAMGRFAVPGVPEAATVQLRLTGRGRVLLASVDPAEKDLVITCDLPTR